MRHLRHRFPAVRISVEVEKPARPGLQELAAEADVVFYSKSWAQVGRSFIRSYTSPLTLSPCLVQGNGYEAPEDCLRAQAASTPKAYVLRLHRLQRLSCAEPILSWLLCCTWGNEGASALELTSFAYEHSPAYVQEKVQVVECVLESTPRTLRF